MRLHYWERPEPPHNFGDQLNRWLWPRLLPDLPALPRDAVIVGLGSLLGQAVPLPEARHLLVLGSGAGYGPPHVPDARWRVYGLRGPLTAAALGLDAGLAAGDPAIMVPAAAPALPPGGGTHVGIMPHWRSAGSGWRALCEDRGWRYVDPHATPEVVLSAITSCSVLLTEALHGAVVSDAFRVPWIPFTSSAEVLRFKWVDHFRMLGLDYTPHLLPALYAREAVGWRSRARRMLARAAVQRLLQHAPRMLSTGGRLRYLQDGWQHRLDRLRADVTRGSLLSPGSAAA